MSKRFIDDAKTLVNDSIDGLLQTSGGTLSRLDGYDRAIRVVLRTDYDSAVKTAGRVALISGGGSGHEPAHAGFIGEGMLTAAVCGDVFASPSVDAVFAAILTVTGPAGCLLIIKNYTGDRLNFGLAAERARTLGVDVRSVFVADDVALPDARQPRGVAGTCLVHKVAGHVAQAGGSLEDVYNAASAAAKRLYSLGASLSTCTLPGQARNTRLDGDVYELGLGIHGEAGAEQLPMEPASAIVAKMVKALSAALPDRSGEWCLLVNNLGAVPPLELSFVAGIALRALEASGVNVTLSVCGALVTSLEMNGLSFSLLAADAPTRDALLSPTAAAGWVRAQRVVRCAAALVELPNALVAKAGAAHTGDGLGKQARDAIAGAMAAIIENERQLTEWDTISGDGDCGLTLKKGAEAVIAELGSLPADPAALCKAIARIVSQTMGGSSGVLIAIFFSAAAAAIERDRSRPALVVGAQAGTEAVMSYGGATVGSRTMVDALAPTLQTSTLSTMAVAAMAGAQSTAAMKAASHGRSQYLTTDLTGVPDPGAMAVAWVLEKLAAHLG